MRVLDMLDDSGRLTPMGSSKLSFDFSPEWARTLAKAREYGVLEGAVKVAAVLSREDELRTMNTLDRYNHPDGDIMSLLQAIDLVEGILNTRWVADIRDLPWKGRAISALEAAGFKHKTVMAEHCTDRRDHGGLRTANGKGASKDRPLVRHFAASCLLGGIPHAGDDERDHRKVCEPCVWRRMV